MFLFLYRWSLPWFEGAKFGVLILCHLNLLKLGCANSGVFGGSLSCWLKSKQCAGVKVVEMCGHPYKHLLKFLRGKTLLQPQHQCFGIVQGTCRLLKRNHAPHLSRPLFFNVSVWSASSPNPQPEASSQSCHTVVHKTITYIESALLIIFLPGYSYNDITNSPEKCF